MSEVRRLARVVTAEGHAPVIRFSVCMMPGRKGIVRGFRWVSTDCAAVVAFLLACWNARHELAQGEG